MRWQKLYSAWNGHRVSIMGETPHWYLWGIATHPGCEGKNVANTLLNTVIEMSEAEIEKFPVYLEVTNPKTTTEKYALSPNAWGLVGMFRDKYGFEVMEYHEGAQTIAYHLLRRDSGGKIVDGNPAAGAVAGVAAGDGTAAAAAIEGAAVAVVETTVDEGQWV